ncbi:hypothetical protein P4U90_08040 [Cytobacillus kochii]|uniref:hypothetical protein n=1 Tax=Cytobacillus kochii TaxID=859143 RepID=UPI002E1B0CC0|nr:hypothetical protein [Cytobacillus kochii]
MMFKKVILTIMLVMGLALPVYAHLTGAFADFLAIVYDESTIDKLKDEMKATEKEIAALEPQVESLETAFKQDQGLAVDQLQFYSDVGLDTWLAMTENGEDIVDIQGNYWLIEQQIDAYLEELNTLYLSFKQLEAAKNALEGHQELLGMIEKNIQARATYLAENEGLGLEQIANYLDIDWTAEIEDHIIAGIERDNKRINEELTHWVVAQPDGTYRLSGEWLNTESDLSYYFRADHVYMVYERPEGHVILIGQVLQNKDGQSASLILEEGFYNGFFLPKELLEELIPFTLSYETLKNLDGVVQPYLTQKDGYLQLQTK